MFVNNIRILENPNSTHTTKHPKVANNNKLRILYNFILPYIFGIPKLSKPQIKLPQQSPQFLQATLFYILLLKLFLLPIS